MDIIGIVGWFFGVSMLMYHFNYYVSTHAVVAPYLAAKGSKGKKILMVIDNGVSGYELIAAEKEALGYSVKKYGNFRAYEESVKKFYGTTMALAHVSLEVMIPPSVAVWLQYHGKEITEDAIDALPDSFQYLRCEREISTGEGEEICGWMSPLIPAEKNYKFSVTELLQRLRNKDKENAIDLCPECGNIDMLRVHTDRSMSTIPAQTIYNLSDVRSWVQEVANPLNMDMAIERTKINTMRSMQDSFGQVLKWATVMIPLLMVLGIVYVMVTQNGGNGSVESLKSTAQNINL